MRNRRLVYSTEGGRVEKPEARRPAARSAGGPSDGVVRIFRERAGRGGTVVTVIRGLPERGSALDARAAELKRLCGAGGTVKDAVVEIQGDHRERVAEHLRALAYTVKLAGG